jgi:hypothetical protein
MWSSRFNTILEERLRRALQGPLNSGSPMPRRNSHLDSSSGFLESSTFGNPSMFSQSLDNMSSQLSSSPLSSQSSFLRSAGGSHLNSFASVLDHLNSGTSPLNSQVSPLFHSSISSLLPPAPSSDYGSLHNLVLASTVRSNPQPSIFNSDAERLLQELRQARPVRAAEQVSVELAAERDRLANPPPSIWVTEAERLLQELHQARPVRAAEHVSVELAAERDRLANPTPSIFVTEAERLLQELRQARPVRAAEHSNLEISVERDRIKKEQKALESSDETEKLFDGVVPQTDVMFGRGTAIYDWPGNVALRELIKRRQDEYKGHGDTRIGKTAISREIVEKLEREGVSFWERANRSKEWKRLDYEKDGKKIREKISSALRSPYDNTDYYKQKRQRFERLKKAKAAAKAAKGVKLK